MPFFWKGPLLQNYLKKVHFLIYVQPLKTEGNALF